MEDIVVAIEEENDGFNIRIGDRKWRFNQEDTKTGLVDVFEELGFESTYEEVY